MHRLYWPNFDTLFITIVFTPMSQWWWAVLSRYCTHTTATRKCTPTVK